jgi:hypothetical protein
MNRKRVSLSGSFCFISLLLTIVFSFSSRDSYAQIEMKQTGSYFQDFNSLSKTGSANTWIDNQTLPGWYWQCETVITPLTYFSDDGTFSYYGKRCYGTTNDSDRAIGGLCNNSNCPIGYGMKLYNSSAGSISRISVSYTGEQWRVGLDDSPQQIQFYYKISSIPEISFSASISSNGWIGVSALNFVSPKTNHSIIKVLNGNDSDNRKIIAEYSIPGISIPSGSYIYLRWNDVVNGTGDHGLAIDDVTVKWTVPAFVSPNVWTGTTSNDWFNNNNWSKASVPGTDTNVEIAAVVRGAVCNDNITIKNLQIVNGGLLTIEPGKTITVNESSIFEGQNCMILKSPLTLLSPSNDHAASASFLGKGTVSGLGSIQAERYISEYLTDTDGWHFFSSPVDNCTIDSQFLPGTYDDLYTYYEIGDTWLNQKTTPDLTRFVNGLGYLLSYNISLVRTISGLPNNSDIKFINLSFTANRGWHLLGNPFPCGVSWGGTDWGISGISGVAKLLNNGGTYSDLSSGETIPAMNGFFVKVNSEINSITIPKSSRVHSIAEGWKQAKSSVGKKIKLVINSNSNNTFAETKISLNENATTGYDSDSDSHYLSGMDGTPLFYSVLSNGQELSTNCVPETTSSIFNLEFTPGLATEYTLKAEISDDWSKTSSFILEDKQTNTKHLLSNSSSYKFTSKSTDSPDRFRLIVDVITGINQNESKETIQIKSENRHVSISIPGYPQSGNLNVYDLSGKQIISRVFTKGSIDFTLPNAGYYLIQLMFNNKKVTRKILIL